MPRYNLNREEVELIQKALYILSKESNSTQEFNRLQNLSVRLKSKIDFLDKTIELASEIKKKKNQQKDDPDAIH